MSPRKVRKLVFFSGIALIFLSLVALASVLLFAPLKLALSLSPAICPGAIYAIETQEPVVALTIDDGPDARIDNPIDSGKGKQNTTEAILDVLAAHQAKATFFVLSDKIKQRENQTAGKTDTLISRIVEAGHELGNHLTRDELSIGLGDRFEHELGVAEGAIAKYPTTPNPSAHPSAPKPSPAIRKWLRPGGGWCSNQMADIAQKRGYSLVLGLVWPLDTHIPWSGFAQRFVRWNARPGAIVILHDNGQDSGRGERTAKTLELVLSKLDKRYRVVTLSELVEYGKTIANPTRFPYWLEPLRQRLILLSPLAALRQLPSLHQWLEIGLLWFGFGLLLLGLGFQFKFIEKIEIAQPLSGQSPVNFWLQQSARLFLLPATAEELIFRGLLLPNTHQLSGALNVLQAVECTIGLLLYIAFHLLGGIWVDWRHNQNHHTLRSSAEGTTHPPTRSTYFKTFKQPIFLVLTGILGLYCTIAYLRSGSLWPAILFHWLVVVSWLLLLGGWQQLHPVND